MHENEALLAGFITGLIGSLHCVGMCGPIAIAIFSPEVSKKETFTKLMYHSGRVFTYVLIGLGVALVGLGSRLINFQQSLSVFCGVLILAVSIMQYYKIKLTSGNSRFRKFMNSKLGYFLKSQKSIYSYLVIGIINGFLPCGLVTVAAIQSASVHSVWGSGLLMFGFGLGTIPLLSATVFIKQKLGSRHLFKLNLIMLVFGCVLGAMLIIRGLNLGIPYVSPAIENNQFDCCKKH